MSGVKMEKPASMIEWLHPVAQFPNLSILTQNNIPTYSLDHQNQEYRIE